MAVLPSEDPHDLPSSFLLKCYVALHLVPVPLIYGLCQSDSFLVIPGLPSLPSHFKQRRNICLLGSFSHTPSSLSCFCRYRFHHIKARATSGHSRNVLFLLMLFGQKIFASQMWNLLKQLLWSIHMQRYRPQNLLKVYSRKPYDSRMITDFLMVWRGLFGGPFCFQIWIKAEILMPLSAELCFVF